MAEKNNVLHVLAQDPDSDRFSAAEKDQDTGAWKIFTGDQLGTLFAYDVFMEYKHAKKLGEYDIVGLS